MTSFLLSFINYYDISVLRSSLEVAEYLLSSEEVAAETVKQFNAALEVFKSLEDSLMRGTDYG